MSHSSSPPPPSSRSKGKVYRLNLDSESKLLASETAKRESLRPPPVPKGLELVEVAREDARQEIDRASNTLENAVSDQTHAVYLVIGKLNKTTNRQETLSKGQQMLTILMVIMLACQAFLLVLLLSFLRDGS